MNISNEDRDNTAEILLASGFSPELVKAAIEISKKSEKPTNDEQEILDKLKAQLLARLNNH